MPSILLHPSSNYAKTTGTNKNIVFVPTVVYYLNTFNSLVYILIDLILSGHVKSILIHVNLPLIMHAFQSCMPQIIMHPPSREATSLQLCAPPSERAVWFACRAFRGSGSVLFFFCVWCLPNGARETVFPPPKRPR